MSIGFINNLSSYAIYFFIGFAFIGFLKYKTEKAASLCSGIATSLGVLGTFIGIAIGLAGLDVNDLTNSIPQLLKGMKFAFVTSIAGMFVSIIIKIWYTYIDSKNDKEENIDDIVELFNNMSREIKKLNETLIYNQKQTSEIFSNLDERFDDNQKSLKGELESLNSNLSQKQDILINEFKVFGERMAHNNTEALIDALNGVIKDFNNKISEQFGENFKELNIAVTKLLDWQENYKDTIESTQNQLRTTTESIKSIDNSLGNISISSSTLIDTSKSINLELEAVTKSQEEVRKGLISIDEIANKAKESIPSLDNYFENNINNIIKTMDTLNISLDSNLYLLNNYLDQLMKNVTSTSTESIKTITSNLDESNKLIKNQAATYIKDLEELTSEFSKCIPGLAEEISRNHKKFTETLDYFSTNTNDTLKLSTQQIKAQCETLEKTNVDLRDKLQIQLNHIHEDTSKQIVKIVEEMEKVFLDRTDKVNQMLEHELKESLNSLGTQLATLSGKFVEDYMPLTERLKQVVSMAEGV